MIFNSPQFLLFLTVVFAVYWAPLTTNGRHRIPVLLIASYVFYGWWDVRFLALILFSSWFNYRMGIAIHDAAKERTKDRLLLLTLIVDLGVLFFFKYFNFFLDSLQYAFNMDSVPWTINIILPVGISFFTFQTLGYCLDIHQENQEPTRDIPVFFTFVSFFPLLLAGPIERGRDLLRQLAQPRSYHRPQLVEGLRLLLIGAFKKMVIADRFAPLADTIFDHPTLFGGLIGGMGVVFFAVSIYADFSAYSDIARGAAKLFGIDLSRNFNRPYSSISLAEFWTRWHITLNTWFRDYVFTPISYAMRNRGLAGVMVAIIITFLLSGLWHGPQWTFVTWGLLLGLFMAVELAFEKRLAKLPKALRWSLTMGVILGTMIVFKATSLTKAWEFAGRILTFDNDPVFLVKRILSNTEQTPLAFAVTLLLGAGLFVLDRWTARADFIPRMEQRPMLRYGGYAGLLLLLLFFGVYVDQKAFIYFQF
ncbi:MAG: MBOAT family protein [Flavobacteriales bacterium]|nr:MAG: MBOAT family protein [Flavobacteriales bacterium]